MLRVNRRSKFYKFFSRYIKIPLFIFKLSIIDAIKQDGIEHAGYLAFLSILSLFPFLIFMVSITGLFGNSDMSYQLTSWLLSALPTNMSKALTPRITEILSTPPQSLLTIAIIGIIWTASSAVEGLRTILNRAYRVKSPPTYILGRLMSIAQFFAITLTITITTVILIVVPAILKKIELTFSVDFAINYNWFYFRQIAIFFILTIGTSLLYFVIPNIHQKIDNTLPGSILCIILWSLILDLFSLYLKNFNQFNLLYGSLGGIIGSLMFFYFISLVFIIGAEFNYHFARVYNKKFTAKQ